MPTQINSAGITFNDATSLTSANIGTGQLVNGSVTAAKLGTNEQKQICKAWVRYEGGKIPDSISTINGTYVQSGTTTITVTTSVNHNLVNGQVILLSITSGSANVTYSVATVVSPTIFTCVTNNVQTTSGNAIIQTFPTNSGGSFTSTTTVSTTTFTITTPSNHGLTTGNIRYVNFTSTNGTSVPSGGLYNVTVVSPTVFTITESVVYGGPPSGAALFSSPIIRSSYNISSITYSDYNRVFVNFTTPMNDTNYTVNASGNNETNFLSQNISTTSFRLNLGSNSALSDMVSVLVFGN
jgi:hypothetical protein